MDVLSRLKERKEMFVSFEGRNDRLIFDSHDEIESLRDALREADRMLDEAHTDYENVLRERDARSPEHKGK